MGARADAGGQNPRARARGLRWSALCWLVILALIGVVQLLREEWFDAGVFLVAIALVAISGLQPAQASWRIAPHLVVIPAAALAGAMSLLPRHSAGMIVAVLVTGAAAVVVAWPGAGPQRRSWTSGLRRLGTAWTLIVIVGCLWELAEFVVGLIAPQHPSFALSDLVDPLLDTMLGKALFAVAWLACGVFLMQSGSRRRVER